MTLEIVILHLDHVETGSAILSLCGGGCQVQGMGIARQKNGELGAEV